MTEENRRAAQRAHDNVGRSDADYDDEGRPAAARAHEADADRERASQTEEDDGADGGT